VYRNPFRHWTETSWVPAWNNRECVSIKAGLSLRSFQLVQGGEGSVHIVDFTAPPQNFVDVRRERFFLRNGFRGE
jgi:hypothetical protein